MALNIKSPRADALARELAAMRKQSITEVVEAALDVLKEREDEARETLRAERRARIDAFLAELDAKRGPDLDPRPLKEIRDELWGGL
ncbi:MAG: type II toxin-antitoxin system VapB family antitoxin [Hyphomonadaceae bacterium]|jgi:hypothetical protein|nr:type II toxin-antitoxin system VapB family antitoxin [Hyphomonadaceae bacterium]